MKGTTAFALANGYTDETVEGAGAIKGKNCTIEKTEVVEGGSIVTFKWTLDDGTVQTSDLFVEKGDIGYSIVGASFNSSGKLVIELSNGTFLPPVSMPTTAVEISEEDGNIITQKTDGVYAPATDISNLVEKEPNKGLSTNDYDDIEKKTVADNKSAIELLNNDSSTVGSVAYQIADAVSKLNKLEKKIVDSLPSVEDADANAIYLLKNEGTNYEMYTLVTLSDGSKALASLGGTDIDLEGYLTEDKAKTLYLALLDISKEALASLSLITEDEVVYLAYNGSKLLTKAQIENLLSDYATTEYVNTEVGKKVSTTSIAKKIDSTSTDDQIPSAKVVYDELENKIDKEYGTSHKGEVLVVGEDGKITAKTFDVIDDSETTTTTTWSSQKIDEALTDVAKIDDTSTTSTEDTWSAKKISDSLVDKADKEELNVIPLIYNQNTDILAYALTCPQAKRTLVRIHSANATNNPFGITSDTDFIYEISKVDSANAWIYVKAKDVRTNREFINTRNDVKWLGWQELATMDKVGNKCLKVGTVSGTPNASGNLSANVSEGTIFILSGASKNACVSPFTYNGRWTFHCTGFGQTYTPVTTELSIEYVYYEL